MQPQTSYQIKFRLWPKNGTTLLILCALTLALLIGSNEAIVKQSISSSQSSSSSSSSSSPQSQQRSDDQLHQPQQSQSQSQQQQPQSVAASSGPMGGQAQPYSISSSSQSQSQSSAGIPSTGASGLPSASMQSVSSGPSSMQMQQVNSPQSNSRNQMDYSNSGAGGQKSYLDSMTAAASNNEQSYQAAANSVNMALANSGIFSGSSANAPSSYGSAGAQQQQQQPQANAAQLNPLHYFYYPAKDNSAASMGKPAGDMMASSGSGYQSSQNFADQLNSALNGAGSAPDMAASNQDPTYLPQPSMDQFRGGSSQNGPTQNSVHNSQAHQYNDYPQQSSAQQQQQQQPGSSSVGGVSFPSNGPNDYMNLAGSSHQPSQQAQGGAVAQQSAQSYPNLYNQLGDLSTLNFGNTGALSSPVASYLPSPNSQQQQSVSPQQPLQNPSQQQPQAGQMHDPSQQHNAADMFSSPFGSPNPLAGFNSAASQLSPSAMSPQQNGVASNSNSANGLFGSSSLFGNSQQSQQQQSNQQPTNNLYSSQQYLSSFMSPQQAASYASALAASGLQGLGQSANDQSVSASQISPSSSTATASGSSSKRFGISSFIMPMLALAGLSLLIPTMSNIGTAVGRKKRSIGEERISSSSRQQQILHDSMNGSNQVAKENSIGEYLDRIERYYAMYKKALE